MKQVFIIASMLFAAVACNNSATKTITVQEPKIKTETVNYLADSVSMNGFIAYDEALQNKRPVVLIVHEWWGQNEYTRRRAQELAALGYLAMAVDFYGKGELAETPERAMELAMPFYMNPAIAKARFDAALKSAKSHPIADTTRIAAMGYCFGGSMVLNMARMGEPLKGVVSFHGGLAGVPLNKELLKSDVLVCHGAADNFVSETEVNTFKRQMDSIGAHYKFVSYPGATHAFSNPEATEKGKKFNMPIAYNAAADTASWKEMKLFFEKVLK